MNTNMTQKTKSKSYISTTTLVFASVALVAVFVAFPAMRGQLRMTDSMPIELMQQNEDGVRASGVRTASYVTPARDRNQLGAALAVTGDTIYQADVLPVYPNFVDVETGQEIQLCQGFGYGDGCCDSCGIDCGGECGSCDDGCGCAVMADCDGNCGGACGNPGCDGVLANTYGADPYGNGGAGGKPMVGVDSFNSRGREPGWSDQHMVPWEAFAYGEYVGPHRTPHVGEYRLRISDQLEFVYMLTRERSRDPYQMYVGDTISITSREDPSISNPSIIILRDGMITLPYIGQVRASGKSVADLQRELNDKFAEYINRPGIVLQVVSGDTPLNDLLQTVDARAGQGGQRQAVTVAPDGTVQLPMIGSVPAIGLTLEEVRREVNARYQRRIRGIEVTPILTQRSVGVCYVVGEVENPGQVSLNGPTTVLQALAQSGQIGEGANLRQVIVFRRDHNWRLMATRLDLAGTFYGRRPHPTDDIWLRPSDIVMVPKKPIQRFSEAVNLYLTNSLYAIFPQQGVALDFDGFTNL